MPNKLDVTMTEDPRTTGVVDQSHSAELAALLAEIERALQSQKPASKPEPAPRVRIYGLD